MVVMVRPKNFGVIFDARFYPRRLLIELPQDGARVRLFDEDVPGHTSGRLEGVPMQSFWLTEKHLTGRRASRFGFATTVARSSQEGAIVLQASEDPFDWSLTVSLMVNASFVDFEVPSFEFDPRLLDWPKEDVSCALRYERPDVL